MRSLNLGAMGGLIYVAIELLWRGRSHWTMIILGGLCFVIIGGLNEFNETYETGLVKQVFLSAVIVTILEFIAGLILNKWLKLGIWDYSDMWGNVLGQICPQYFLLWLPVSLAAILIDDLMRWKLFGEERTKYKL